MHDELIRYNLVLINIVAIVLVLALVNCGVFRGYSVTLARAEDARADVGLLPRLDDLSGR